MREDVCKQHLEKIYGRERAERYSHELQNGLEGASEGLYGCGYDGTIEDVGGMGVSRRLANLQPGEDDDEGEVEGEVATAIATATERSNAATASDSANNSTEKMSRVENDDDEIEATFDDIVPSQAQPLQEINQEADVPGERNYSEDNLEQENGDDDDHLEDPQADKGMEDPKAPEGEDNESDDLEEPKDVIESEDIDQGSETAINDESDEKLEEPVPDSSANHSHDDAKRLEEANDEQPNGVIVEEGPNLDAQNDNSIEEISQTQEQLVFDGTQSQSLSQEDLPLQMTQDSVFGATGTQDTPLHDAFQGQISQNTCTQDTLVFDSTQDQDVDMSQQHSKVAGSQDY